MSTQLVTPLPTSRVHAPARPVQPPPHRGTLRNQKGLSYSPPSAFTSTLPPHPSNRAYFKHIHM
ncbi:hypothetical protein GY45DRAFT_1332148 [Cubamyces sp. BRFM 1775]|nr:hypothetical protein GY45DRAFT_1332148 [Cubamyces sp. BRFM 1775]